MTPAKLKDTTKQVLKKNQEIEVNDKDVQHGYGGTGGYANVYDDHLTVFCVENETLSLYRKQNKCENITDLYLTGNLPDSVKKHCWYLGRI